MAQTRLLAPILAIGVVVALASAHMAMLSYYGEEPSNRITLLYNWAFAIIIASGVETDRHGRPVGDSYEYSAYIFFLWPYVLPVYLFQTRRWRGLAVAFAVMVLFLVPWLASLVPYFWLSSSGT
jgi:hypothetical protein